MKKYETLFFDLDDTLIDDSASKKYAFNIVLDYLNIQGDEKLENDWIKFDENFWNLWQSGKIKIPSHITDWITYLRANRFILFFKNLNLSFETAVYINELYCNNLGVCIIPIIGAYETLKTLNKTHEIVIATNGVKKVVIQKLEKIDVLTFISSIICPEDANSNKPHLNFYNFLINECKNTKDKSKMLMVGDSLTSDIQVGLNIGIDTCWFNHRGLPLKDDVQPTLEINTLLELTRKIR